MKNKFTSRLLRWYRQHGRHDLPWQRDADPYRVWISEIMLQQTQVQTVIPYYERFVDRFPDIRSLADAPVDDVLYLWTGLGYYARARNLHKAAQMVRDEYDGCFPEDRTKLESLPGIGRSTAAAILALSRNQPHAILDVNVKRVLSRYHAVPGWPGKKVVENRLWELAQSHTPERDAGAYTQAIMDLGATVCTRARPACERCPVAGGCEALRLGGQADFPGRKPQKDKPVRRTCFAILEDRDGRILLQKRPPAGIWGGLWSFPECSPETDVEAWIKQAFGSTVCDLRREAGLRHTFSHFHLDITPVRVVLAGSAEGVREQGDFRWIHPAEELTLGTAAPVKKLIESLS